MGSEPKAIAELVEAARAVRRVREAQSAYTRELQSLAAEARRTGKSQSHRIGPRVHDYGDSIAALMTALAKYERSAHPPLQEAAPDPYCELAASEIPGFGTERDMDGFEPPGAPMLDPRTRLLEAEELLHEWEASCTIETPPRLAYRTAKFLHQEAPTCGTCGGSDSPPDFAGPTYKAPWPCSECGRRRCCPDKCTRCAPPATEPCPCGEGGNPLHVFVHPAPKEPR